MFLWRVSRETRIFANAQLFSLGNPEPNLLEHVPWNLFGPDFGIQCRLATPNVRLGWVDEFGAFEDFPEEEEL